jgi:hypothetical protein
LKKIPSKSSLYLYVFFAYFAYWILPSGMIVLNIVNIFKFRILSLNKINKQYFFLVAYIIITWFVSLITLDDRLLTNFISSSKILVLLFFSWLISNSNIYLLPWQKILNQITFSLPIISIIVFIGVNLFGTPFWGMRGDVGVFLASLGGICVGYLSDKYTKKNFFMGIIISIILLTTLLSLHGRTSVVLFGVIFLSAILAQDNTYKNINHKILKFIILILITGLIITIGIFLLSQRGGIEYVTTEEARLLAVFFWYEVMSSTGLINVLFGHGLGACADKVADGFGVYTPHVNQIIRSANGCYVSWGFHNTVLAFIFEYGVIGLSVAVYFLIKLYKKQQNQRRYLFFLFIIIIGAASPNNHLINNDLIGSMFFLILGIFMSFSDEKHG